MRSAAHPKLGFLALATAIVVAPVAAQQEERIRLAEAAAGGIIASEIARDVGYLASDELRGRATPSPGLDSASAYIARILAELGIRPMGDDGSYFQHYTMRSSVLDTAAVVGAIGDRPIRYGEHFVVQSFLRPGVHEGDVVYVGAGIHAPDHGIDSYAGIDIRGRWLLVHGGTPLPAGVSRNELGIVGVDWFTAAEVARERGAAGVITLPTPGTEAGWSSFRNRRVVGRDLEPAFGRAYSAYPLPRITLSAAAAELLLAGERLSLAAVAAADTSRTFPASFALGPAARFSVDLVSETTVHRPYNVVGLIEGSDPAVRDQWISMAAHLDGAVGRGVAANGDSIYNSADDNASGSAGALAVTRAIMAGPRPRRSILVIWDSGEEVGLWGSRHLANGPLAERIVAHLNVDMIGRTRVPGTDHPAENDLAGPGEVFIAGPAVMSSSMNATVQRVRERWNHATLTPRHDDPAVSFFYPRTDAAPYIEVGIPVLQFFTGLHADYHRQSDEVAELDIPKMEGISRMVYLALWMIAEQAERPRWDRPIPSQLRFVTPRP